MAHKVIMFTDGASRGNPGPGGWAVVCAYHDGDREKGVVFEMGGAEKKTTNNRMELLAFIEGMSYLREKNINGVVTLYTDSSYLVNGATKWLSQWKATNWITKAKSNVLNKDLWERIAEFVDDYEIVWRQIEGHSGITGNERCDEIATSFADGKRIYLYNGSLKNYGLNITSFTYNNVQKKHIKISSGKAYSYVSKVDGVIQTHNTWAECRDRVSGKAGARFRKSSSKENEIEIKKEFGE